MVTGDRSNTGDGFLTGPFRAFGNFPRNNKLRAGGQHKSERRRRPREFQAVRRGRPGLGSQDRTHMFVRGTAKCSPPVTWDGICRGYFKAPSQHVLLQEERM